MVSTTCFSQTWTSTCDATVVSERIFRNDVYKLAQHRLVETNNPYKDSIEIPSIFRDSIAKILYSFYNLQSTLIKDTLMTYFGYADFDTSGYPQYEYDSCHFQHNYLHNPYYAPSVKRVSLGINRNATNAWADDWAIGNFNNTSNSDVNELVNKYELSIKMGVPTPAYYGFTTITTKRALNTNGLAKKFYDIMGGTTLNVAEAYTYIGDGNSIHFDYLTDGVMVTFRKGCGDCPAGCTYGRFWKFKVNTYTDCSVTYIKDSIFWVFVPQFNGIYVCNRNGGDIVTPVYFKNVIGEVSNTKANLAWDVLTESNIRYYVVEKSFDGRVFVEAGRVYATSQSTPAKSYTWQDKVPLAQSSFFRVKAVENSGEVIYSNTLLLKTQSTRWSVTVFPNPVINHEMQLQYNGEYGEMQLQLYSMEGRLLFSKKCKGESISSAILLPHTIGSGTYLLKVKQATGDNEMKQLIVIK